MIVTIRDPEILNSLDLEQVRGYLRSHYWQEERQIEDHTSLWTHFNLCRGTLVKQGRSFILQHPSQFTLDLDSWAETEKPEQQETIDRELMLR
jgi:hypothetical protein